MLIKNTFVRPAKIKPHDDLNIILMTLVDHIAQHVGFHVWIRVLAVQRGRIKCHYASGIDN